MKKNHSKNMHKKMYKMIGCSNNTRKKRTSRKYLGGDSFAYTGKPLHTQSNPFLAYTGGQTNNTSNAYPKTDPPRAMNGTFFNAQSGGTCSTCSIAQPLHFMNGGNCGPQCNMGFKAGGKTRRNMSGGNPGIPYPDGLVGYKWTPSISDWPGVGRIPGNNNYYPINNYNDDISRQMKSLGGNFPFLKGGKKKNTTQKGGVLSNFIGKDLINLGRQFQYGVGSAYNAISGYASPVNPLPWKDQFPNKVTSINSKVL